MPNALIEIARHSRRWRAAFGALALLALAQPLPATAQARFASPEEAVAALVDASRLNNEPILSAILGPHGDKLVNSGDPVQDARRRAAFVRAYDASHNLALEASGKVVLQIGKDAWPMPIPLVKSGGSWYFDTRDGEREILARHIGRNELAAIQVCLAIADAERDYASQDRNDSGVLQYAPKLASAPGKHDGLYWETAPDAPPSPLGPLVAAAASRGYSGSGPAPLTPYHGYYYRILTAQGRNAPGGERAYIIKGRMIGGFAVLAYPARYRASGVMSFMVGEDGVVYEKNLGRNTAAVAEKMTAYDPDATWTPHQGSKAR